MSEMIVSEDDAVNAIMEYVSKAWDAPNTSTVLHETFRILRLCGIGVNYETVKNVILNDLM